MTRLADAWRAMAPEQRLAVIAALALLVTMFLPWYGLQGLNRKTGAIDSHSISAFGDVSFVEAAIFLVAAGVVTMLIARAEGRDFQLPGGDGTIVLIAGCWAALLIFFRVFSRPPGGGEPVGIEWGFFLAFVAAGAIAFAGLRMRAGERPQAPARRTRAAGPRPPRSEPPEPRPRAPIDSEAETVVSPAQSRRRPAAPVAARERAAHPPAPPEQLSFEDPGTRAE